MSDDSYYHRYHAARRAHGITAPADGSYRAHVQQAQQQARAADLKTVVQQNMNASSTDKPRGK